MWKGVHAKKDLRYVCRKDIGGYPMWLLLFPILLCFWIKVWDFGLRNQTSYPVQTSNVKVYKETPSHNWNQGTMKGGLSCRYHSLQLLQFSKKKEDFPLAWQQQAVLPSNQWKATTILHSHFLPMNFCSNNPSPLPPFLYKDTLLLCSLDLPAVCHSSLVLNCNSSAISE